MSGIALLIFYLLTPLQPHARELVDVSLTVETTKKGSEARQEAFDQAIESATRSLAENIVGTERVAKSWDQVKPKILKNSTKYVVFIKGKPEGDGKFNVQMRLSPDHLEYSLREAGLIGGGPVRLLPLVMINDSLGHRYLWWADHGDTSPSNSAQKYFARFHKQLAGQFKGKNVSVLDPTNKSFRMSLPASYRVENLRKEDQLLLAEYLKADVVLSGRVNITRLRSDGQDQRIDYQLELWQTKGGRTLAEAKASRVVNSLNAKAVQALMDQMQPELFTEISQKLSTVIANGNLNLSVVKIMIEGNLNPRQHSEVKRILGTVREIRLLRERLFEPSRILYETESTVSGEDLAKAIQRTRFSQYHVSVSSAQDDRLVLKVKASGSGR